MRTLRKGARGTDVTVLTEKLVLVGLLDLPLDYFNDKVERAVFAWQSLNVGPDGKKLTVDGVVGPLTWRSFDEKNPLIFDTPVFDSFYIPPFGDSRLGREALIVGLEELRAGAREIGSNNAGHFVDKYHKTADASRHQWSWCAAFTSWCFEQAAQKLNVPMPFSYTGGAQNILKQLRAKGFEYTASEANPPQPGDIVVWYRGATKTWQGHVGIVWGYQHGVLYVLEGNVGPFPAPVNIFSYVLSRMDNVFGFARIPDGTAPNV